MRTRFVDAVVAHWRSSGGLRPIVVACRVMAVWVGLLSGTAAPVAEAEPAHAAGVAELNGLAARVDALNARFTKPGMPGAIVAVIHRDRVLHLKGYGLANREFGVPWDSKTRYTFFSTTKPMVATAFLRLADAGRVSLDSPVSDWLPDFPRFESPITIRHLLTHTSGLWQDEQAMLVAATNVSYDPVSLEEMSALQVRQPALAHKPGRDYYYNDGGMRLAARVLEAVTGKTFREAMREWVFVPAGMRSADTKPFEPMFFPNEASTYLMDRTNGDDTAGAAIRVGTVVPETSGDGAGVGTIEDLVSFARYLSRIPESGPSLLSRLTAPVEYRPGLWGAYRMCMDTTFHRGMRVFFHFGFYGKGIFYLPDLDAWVIYMRNAELAADPLQQSYVVQLLDAVLLSAGRSVDAGAPEFLMPPPWAASEEERSAMTGRFIEPTSGHVLMLKPSDQGISFSWLGSSGPLVRSASLERRYRTYEGRSAPLIELQRTQAAGGDVLSMRHGDWEDFRPLSRIPTPVSSVSETRVRELAGIYWSPDLGVSYTVRSAAGRLEVGIGSGLREADWFELIPVTADTFLSRARSPRTVFGLSGEFRFVSHDQRVVGMRFSTDAVRGVEFVKLVVPVAVGHTRAQTKALGVH